MLIALAVVSLGGLALSVYTTRVMNCAGDTCDLVMTTPYARVFGFPNAIIAAVYYAALVAFAALSLAGVRLPLWPALAAAGLSLVMSAYLAWALFAKLRRF